MKRILSFLVFSFSLSVSFAQLDNTVEVTNEVKPVVSDVKKVEVKAQVAETQVQHYTMQYAVQSQSLGSYADSPLGEYGSDAVRKGNKRGYVHLGGGSHGNLDGQASYQFGLTDNDALSVDLTLKGFNGKSTENDAFGKYEWKSRDYQNRAALQYGHRFDNGGEFFVKGGFENRLFNYWSGAGETDKQHNVLGDATIGLTPYKTGAFVVGAEAGIRFFKQNYLTTLDDKLGEMLLLANASMAYGLTDEHCLGVGVNFVNSTYDNDELEGMARFRFTPHYIYNTKQMRLKLGIFANSEGKVAPDVSIAYHLNSCNDVYAEVRGYEEDNDFRRLTQLNPYFVPVAGEVKMEAEFHQIDAKVGYRMTGMNGFNADISGGFDMSENQADMVVLSQSKKSLALPMVEFRKSRCFYVNADFSYAYKDVLRIDAKNRLNIESNKHDGEWVKGSYVRPAFEMDWKADFKIVKDLYVGLDWAFACYEDPDLTVNGKRYERNNTVNLGASIRYTLPVSVPFTLFVKGDNLLNQNYDRYFGYRNIGANFLAGLAVSF